METARFTALGVIVREFLSTFNASEARQKLIGRLFNNGNAAGEIGHLLPGYDPVGGGDVAFYTNALKNGTRSPEGVLIDIIATNDVNKGFYQDYYVAAGNSPGAFLNRLYQDLFKGTGIQFSWLPTNVQTTQLNTASTPVGRLNLTRSLVNGALVKYTDPAQPGVLKTIDFRTHMVNLTYQRYLGRAATPAEVTAGKSLMARPLAANSINGSEWLYHKVLASKEYFNLAPAQADGLPDDGLHTNRAWVQAVIDARMYRASTSGEEDIYSQKVLDRFKTQRTAFISALVNGTAYRDLQITDYFQHIHSRNPTDVERTAAQTALKNLATYQGLMSGRYASAEFFSTNAPAIAGGAPNTTTWARAVYIKLFNLNLAPNDPRITALAAQGGTIPARQTAVLALLNGQAYRDILITDRFQLLLGRLPTGNELTAYQNWLKTRRWESIIIDIVANGAANPTITSGSATRILGSGELTRRIAISNKTAGPIGTTVPAGPAVFCRRLLVGLWLRSFHTRCPLVGRERLMADAVRTEIVDAGPVRGRQGRHQRAGRPRRARSIRSAFRRWPTRFRRLRRAGRKVALVSFGRHRRRRRPARPRQTADRPAATCRRAPRSASAA